jgi:ribokinase
VSSAPASESAARVVVVGSVNRDYVCTVAELPRPGETVLSGDFFLNSGGKGANQAVAAARMGASTALIGSVGDDADGRSALDDLEGSGVDTADVDTVAGVRTGAAFVTVAADGENFIVVAPGANDRVSAEQARVALSRRLRPGDVLVTQAEIPLEALVCAVTQADGLGCRVVLNLAPYRLVPDDVLRRCDPLVVNEGEAAALLQEVTGHPAEDPVERAAQLGQLARSAVMTLGAEGAMLAQGDVVEHVRGESVPVVDSTGAGDAFTGALAASLCRGDELLAAVRVGVAAGAYAVGRAGAQASFPRAADVERARTSG